MSYDYSTANGDIGTERNFWDLDFVGDINKNQYEDNENDMDNNNYNDNYNDNYNINNDYNNGYNDDYEYNHDPRYDYNYKYNYDNDRYDNMDGFYGQTYDYYDEHNYIEPEYSNYGHNDHLRDRTRKKFDDYFYDNDDINDYEDDPRRTDDRSHDPRAYRIVDPRNGDPRLKDPGARQLEDPRYTDTKDKDPKAENPWHNSDPRNGDPRLRDPGARSLPDPKKTDEKESDPRTHNPGYIDDPKSHDPRQRDPAAVPVPDPRYTDPRAQNGEKDYDPRKTDSRLRDPLAHRGTGDDDTSDAFYARYDNFEDRDRYYRDNEFEYEYENDYDYYEDDDEYYQDGDAENDKYYQDDHYGDDYYQDDYYENEYRKEDYYNGIENGYYQDDNRKEKDDYNYGYGYDYDYDYDYDYINNRYYENDGGDYGFYLNDAGSHPTEKQGYTVGGKHLRKGGGRVPGIPRVQGMGEGECGVMNSVVAVLSVLIILAIGYIIKLKLSQINLLKKRKLVNPENKMKKYQSVDCRIHRKEKDQEKIQEKGNENERENLIDSSKTQIVVQNETCHQQR